MGSIPTAPTNHLPDGWTLNENTRGQKGVNEADDPVPFFFSAARVTAGQANFSVQSLFPLTLLLERGQSVSPASIAAFLGRVRFRCDYSKPSLRQATGDLPAHFWKALVKALVSA